MSVLASLYIALSLTSILFSQIPVNAAVISYGVFSGIILLSVLFVSPAPVVQKLKDEKLEWLTSQGLKTYATPNIKDYVTKESDIKKITKAYETNNLARVNEIVKQYENGSEYLRRKMIPLTSNTLTTHEKTFNGRFAKDIDNVFYDEDPTSSMLVYKSWNYDKLLIDINKIYRKNVIDDAERDLIVSECSKWSKINKDRPEYLKETEELIKLRKLAGDIAYRKKDMNIILNHNLSYLLQTQVVSKNSFMLTRKFPPGRIIILSATPDIDTIKKIASLSGKTVRVFKQDKQVKRVGKINQVLINSSKNKIKDNVEKIKELNDAEVTITHKSMVGTYNSNSDNIPYGGNVMGYNSLKGKNISIAYTLQAKPEYYKMKYCLLHEDKAPLDKTEYAKVTWHKSRFLFYSAANDKLRNIIMQHIDSEMVQAIERARTLTEDCTVTVFSNFICSIVDPVNVKLIA